MNAASLRAAAFFEQRHADLDSMMTPRIFPQDFKNLGEIQQGMKSRGYEVGLANPIGEATVANFHAILRKWVLGEARATP